MYFHSVNDVSVGCAEDAHPLQVVSLGEVFLLKASTLWLSF